MECLRSKAKDLELTWSWAFAVLGCRSSCGCGKAGVQLSCWRTEQRKRVMGSNKSAYQLLSERPRDKKEGEHRAGSLGEGRADNMCSGSQALHIKDIRPKVTGPRSAGANQDADSRLSEEKSRMRSSA